MTAVVHRRCGELVPLVAVHGRLSYFNACEIASESKHKAKNTDYRKNLHA